MGERICSVDDCTTPAYARGWCRRHYKRWANHGDPVNGAVDRPRVAPLVGRNAPLEVRFWTKVDKTDECWNWLGATDGKGYGLVRAWGKTNRAHRVSWVLDGRELVDGLQLDHLCRNRACVRPDHLDQITGRQNILRSEGQGARNARKTHCPQGHEYSEANTYLWQGKWRICRACRSKT